MKVLKFGGTSVGSARNIKKVAEIINANQEDMIVVLSAVSGTTNSLVQLIKLGEDSAIDRATKLIDTLELNYNQLIDELYDQEIYRLKALTFIKHKFNKLRSLILDIYTNENIILAQGELISTHLFQLYQENLGVQSRLISALDFMTIDMFGEPELKKIHSALRTIMEKESGYSLYITQGYICRDNSGKIANLKRGGSDYSASLIGAAIVADKIEIWTDISGMHNNDPRYVEHTFTIDEISFDEAAELAYFGAKILHPQSIIPAQTYNIPVLLKNTFRPSDKGTIIRNCTPSDGVRAVAAKDGIIAIKIKSFRMLMAYGFLKRIFEVFDNYQTAIDMITTSEIAVSLTIDDGKNLEYIIKELQQIGKVDVEEYMSIICLAGNFSQGETGISASVVDCLRDIPIRMISYGGSNFNMSLLVSTNDKDSALNQLNEGLFASIQEA